VGIAAAFGAPIGGVLFSVEVTASGYFALRNYWRGFYTSIACALMLKILAIATSKKDLTVLFMTDFESSPYSLWEMVSFSALGVVCGILGSLFVFLHAKCTEFLRRTIGPTDKAVGRAAYIFTGIFVVVAASLTYPRAIGEFMGLDQRRIIETLFSAKSLDCQGDSYPSGPFAGEQVLPSLVILCVVHFFLSVMAVR
jgi:H+/Cl- antiporter ClcA